MWKNSSTLWSSVDSKENVLLGPALNVLVLRHGGGFSDWCWSGDFAAQKVSRGPTFLPHATADLAGRPPPAKSTTNATPTVDRISHSSR